MPITPSDDQKNPAASHAQVKEPCPLGAGSSRRQQARRSTESAARRRAEVVPLSQDHLLCVVARVFHVRDA